MHKILRTFYKLVLVGAALSIFGCSGNPSPSASAAVNSETSSATPSASMAQASASPGASASAGAATPVYTYTVVKTYPHDTTSFTEGLFLLNGQLYESTGLNGASELRIESLQTGVASKQISLPSTYFGEGITDWQGKLYQLTWKNEVGFIYNDASLTQTSQFTYTGEGWALTNDGKSLIMDDGSDAITFRDPAAFAIQRTIHVADHGTPVTELNELEYVKGEIYANVWHTNFIVRIDPATGNVNSWIDLSNIEASDGNPEHCLNGIAYDAANDLLYVTGKCWAHVYQITLQPKS